MATRYGKAFRTRAGKYGRYVYRNGKRIGFKILRHRDRIRRINRWGKRFADRRYGRGRY